MALYSNNGASPGTGIPGGSRQGGAFRKNTGLRPSGQVKRKMGTGNPGSQRPMGNVGTGMYRPQTSRVNPGRVSGASSRAAYNPPIAPAPTGGLQPGNMWNADALMQAVMLNQRVAQEQQGYADKLAALRQGWMTGSDAAGNPIAGGGQFWSRWNQADVGQQREKFAQHGSAAGRGVYQSGMTQRSDQDINERFAPTFSDIGEQYGQPAVSRIELEQRQQWPSYMMELLQILNQSRQNQMPGVG